MLKNKIVVMLLSVLFSVVLCNGETLIDFDFSVLPGNNLGPLTATDSIADHVVLESPGLNSGGSVGVSGSNFTSGEFNWWQYNMMNGATGTGWMTCTLQAESGYLLDLSSVRISLWRNGAGAPTEMRFIASTDRINFTQVGNIIDEPVSGDFTFRDYAFDLSGLGQVSSLELRFSPLPGSASGQGNLHVNDLFVEGAVVLNNVPQIINLAPANDAAGQVLQLELSWSSINTTSPAYEVNLGTDTSCSDIILNYDAGSATSYLISEGLLDYQTEYYWRIDLWEGGVEYPGPVWSFTTRSAPADNRVIDNFDGYIHTSGLKAVWQDGSVNGSGAVITEELTGSMQLNYTNQGPIWLSKVGRSFTPVADWTADSMALLAFAVKGQSANQAQSLKVTLSDGVQQAAVEYDDSDILTKNVWSEIFFRLSDFSSQGVDLTNIESIEIQIGDGQTPATGMIYVDDLMLYSSRCVPEYRSTADYNEDCVVDISDFEALIQYWLQGSFQVSAQDPGTGALRAYYQFDDSGTVVADSSANTFHASVTSPVWQSSGHDGGCLQISSDTVVTLPAAVFDSVDQEVTISFRIKSFQDALTGINDQILAMCGDVPIDNNSWEIIRWDIPNPAATHDQWHHCAVVKDAANHYAAVYWDGVLVSEYDDADAVLEGTAAGETVLRSNAVYTFTDTACWIDDLRIYDAALSHNEVVYLFGGSSAQITQPIPPLTAKFDYNGSGKIDLADFAILSADWLTD